MKFGGDPHAVGNLRTSIFGLGTWYLTGATWLVTEDGCAGSKVLLHKPWHFLLFREVSIWVARVLGFELFGHRFDLTVTTWLPADERSCCSAFFLDFLDLKVDEMYKMGAPNTHTVMRCYNNYFTPTPRVGRKSMDGATDPDPCNLWVAHLVDSCNTTTSSGKKIPGDWRPLKQMPK